MLDFGIIGNCKTCALINKKAAVEWFCYPDFNSPSVFAKILDRKKGGSFEILTKERYAVSQKYVEDTNILETTFKSRKSGFVVIDFFPRYRKILPNRKNKLFRQNRMIRIIKPLKGKPVMKIKYEPKLNYAWGEDQNVIVDDNLLTINGGLKLSLISNVNYDLVLKPEYFSLDYTRYFVIGQPDNPCDFSVEHCQRLMNSTKKYWKKWVSSLVLPERNRDIIVRSALVLKLLTFSETGAIIAAPTTSIPEEIGSSRTWDYRFCWIRDASFTVDALKKIGRDHEAKKLMSFIFENCIAKKKPLQIMYGIFGETDLKEKELKYLEGYKGSKPVRIGNAAYSQKQNDIYGTVIDVIYLYYVFYEYEKKMPGKYWKFLRYLVSEIDHNWRKKDSGIWEFRGILEHFTYSKLMCFVGVDRAIQIAQHYRKERLAEKWAFLRDKIKEDILKNAWNEKKRAFTQYYGGDELDASVLLMSYHNFLDNKDPRLVSTVKRIYEELQKNSFVQRYKCKDDFGVSKSAFTICSFWLIDALYDIGEVAIAHKMYRKITWYLNHLGLLSEDIDIQTKKLIGNFPQGYSHIALINSSILLSEWSVKRKKISVGENRVV